MDQKKFDLKKLFYPNAIAIVGVSSKNLDFGGASFLVKLKESGYPGALYPINPKAEKIFGLPAFPNLSSLPTVPDLAIVCVPAKNISEVLNECALVGLKHIHVLSSGFREIGTPDGIRLEEEILSIAESNDLLIVGPNCMGPYCPSAKMTAWGAIPGKPGPVGIISQSGGITQRLTEYLYFLGIGVEKAISIGNATVLNTLDYLKFMAEDDKINVIAMYIEGIENGAEFLHLAAKTSLNKPIILWKGGTSESGAATAASHTGSMAGDENLWNFFCHQTGVVPVETMDEWADAVLAFSSLFAPKGNGVLLLGGGGGNSVTGSDVCVKEGLLVPPLSEKTMSWLRTTVPVAGSIAGNPLDDWRVFGDPVYLGEVLKKAYDDANISMVIIDRLIPRKAFHSFDDTDPTPYVIDIIQNISNKKPTVFTVDSEGGDPELAQKGAKMRACFGNAGIPAFPSLKRAARSLFHLYHYYHEIEKRQRIIEENA